MTIESESPQDNAPTAESLQPPESEWPSDRPVEPAQAVELAWQSFFLVQCKPTAEHPDASARPVLLAPGHLGLRFFDDLEDIAQIWFVSATEQGILTSERVERLRFWRLASEKDETYLTALQCKSGALLVVAEEQVYMVDEHLAKWVTNGELKSTTTQLDTIHVDAIVVGKPDDRDVVMVRSDDGAEYSISSSTQGIGLQELSEGMRVQCVVPRRPRALRALIVHQCTSGVATDA